MCMPSGHVQECPLFGRPIHRNGQTGVLELVAQALVPRRKLCEKSAKHEEKKKHCKMGSKTLTSLVNRYLEIHDPWKSTSYGQQSCAAILIGHKDSLCVPFSIVLLILPVLLISVRMTSIFARAPSTKYLGNAKKKKRKTQNI